MDSQSITSDWGEGERERGSCSGENTIHISHISLPIPHNSHILNTQLNHSKRRKKEDSTTKLVEQEG